MSYQFTKLKEEISIRKIVSLHYFEYMSDFSFQGEFHNFWEFCYVDKGDLEVIAGEEKFLLHHGQIIFHRPNEFHALSATRVVAPNLVVISFEAGGSPMKFFENKILTIGETGRNLLAQIVSEARNAFEGPMDDPYLEALRRNPDAPFGCEQMIKLHLEQFMIQLYRDHAKTHSLKRPELSEGLVPPMTDQDILYSGIMEYLEQHIRQPLTVEQVCRDNLIGLSQLKKLFRQHRQGGVMECFHEMKIRTAKQLIRNRQMNFTQIADFLGYTSVHYFSRQFKTITGMTPSEYRASILERAEVPDSWMRMPADL